MLIWNNIWVGGDFPKWDATTNSLLNFDYSHTKVTYTRARQLKLATRYLSPPVSHDSCSLLCSFRPSFKYQEQLIHSALALAAVWKGNALLYETYRACINSRYVTEDDPVVCNQDTVHLSCHVMRHLLLDGEPLGRLLTTLLSCTNVFTIFYWCESTVLCSRFVNWALSRYYWNLNVFKYG